MSSHLPWVSMGWTAGTGPGRWPMPSKNAEVALAQVEAYNRRDLDAQVSGYADIFTMTDHARGMTLRSRDEVERWMGDWIAASSDGRSMSLRSSTLETLS